MPRPIDPVTGPRLNATDPAIPMTYIPSALPFYTTGPLMALRHGRGGLPVSRRGRQSGWGLTLTEHGDAVRYAVYSRNQSGIRTPVMVMLLDGRTMYIPYLWANAIVLRHRRIAERAALYAPNRYSFQSLWTRGAQHAS